VTLRRTKHSRIRTIAKVRNIKVAKQTDRLEAVPVAMLEAVANSMAAVADIPARNAVAAVDRAVQALTAAADPAKANQDVADVDNATSGRIGGN
jgi:hypothetical protein